MATIDMIVVPDRQLKKATIFVSDKPPPMMIGKGSTSYRCATCKAVLLKDILPQHAQNAVYKCPDCATHNRLPVAADRH